MSDDHATTVGAGLAARVGGLRVGRRALERSPLPGRKLRADVREPPCASAGLQSARSCAHARWRRTDGVSDAVHTVLPPLSSGLLPLQLHGPTLCFYQP